MTDKEIKDMSAELIRQLLGSLSIDDLSRINDGVKSDKNQKDVASDSEIFYKSIFEERLKRMILEQLLDLPAKNVDSQFLRGTLNGLFLVRDWFKLQTTISLSRFDKEEETSDNGLPEVTSLT